MGRKKITRSKKNKKTSWKVILAFFAFMIIFTGVTAPFMILYGPFEDAKRTFIGTAMSSMHYQWLATTFLSQDQIDEILGKSQEVVSNENQDFSLIEISKVKDDSIEVATLTDNSTVKVGVTSKLFKEGETTSQIAQNYDAVAAINGGAFTDEEGSQLWTSNGGIPVGVLISDGKILNDDAPGGRYDVAAMTKDGRLLVGGYTLKQLEEQNVVDALTFTPEGASPVLVINGKMTKISGDGGLGTAPRTLIGQRRDGAIVLVVLDSKVPGGRIAATLKESQEIMYKLDCVTATMLDGGKSATMYYDGEVINNPSNSLGERPIASAFIVK